MRFTKPKPSKSKRNRTIVTLPARDTSPDASRLNKVKFPATFETDAVRPALDRKHAAHLTVTAPKHQSEDPK
jgi:hypothetical protein